ncbi:MAG: hypothetical protein JXA60_04400 [Candidatus Coatesbacteria bacterium]|nr:hypothetical protein [Candidatus Coatesbacteria bacterium]
MKNEEMGRRKNLPFLSKPSLLMEILSVCLLFMSAVGYKIYLQSTNPRLRNNGVNLFFSESAIQYYYAKQISEGKKLDEIDKKAQFPEGFPVAESLTLGIEYITGLSYRLMGLGYLPFHRFLLFMICIYSSLSVFVFFYCCKTVYSSYPLSMLLTIFYIVFPPVYQRTIGNFLKEDLAIPFLFLWFLGQLLSSRNLRLSLIFSIIGLSGALLFWHVSPFFIYIALTVYLVKYVIEENKDIVFKMSILHFIIIIFISIISKPNMKAELYLSPVVFAFGLIPLTLILNRKIIRKNSRFFYISSAFLILLISFVLSKMTRSNPETYSHVIEFLLAKIRHLGSKPSDPSLLSFNARLLWLTPFIAPSLKNLIVFWTIPVASFFLGLRYLLKNYDYNIKIWLFIPALICFAGFITISRLAPLSAFLLVLIIGNLILAYPAYRKIILSVLLIVFSFNLFAFFKLNLEKPAEHGLYMQNDDITDVINFFKENTEENEAILGRFSTSASFLAYADKSIVLQPKFENRIIKSKVMEYYKAFFEPEEVMFSLCSKNGIKYIVYEANMLLSSDENSFRYLCNGLNIPRNSLIRYFHFNPSGLRHFRLIYENFFFRIFECGDKFNFKEFNLCNIIYSKEIWGINDFNDELDNEYINTQINKYMKAVKMNNEAMKSIGKKEYGIAERQLEEANHLFQYLDKTQGNLAMLYYKSGRKEKAVKILEKLAEQYPANYQALLFLEQIYRDINSQDKVKIIEEKRKKIRSLLFFRKNRIVFN